MCPLCSYRQRAPSLPGRRVLGRALGIIAGPIWRLLHVSVVVEGAPALPCPTLPQLPRAQFLQPLGVGTVLSRVLEPPPSRTRWERVPWTPGVGVGPRFLVVHSRAPGRLWSLDLSLGRERRLRSCGERESAQGIWHQSLKLPPWGSGLGAGPPSL